MTEKQRINYNAMRKALLDIAQSDSTERLRKNSNGDWGLDYEEALEMAYENMQQHAKDCVKGIKHIPRSSAINESLTPHLANITEYEENILRRQNLERVRSSRETELHKAIAICDN